MGLISDFKGFIMKGNILELAVAVIIAGAFGAIISSLVADVLMPAIGYMMGGVDFSDMGFVLQEADEAAGIAEVSVGYGKLVQTIIDFLIVALIIFLLMRSYEKTQKAEAPAAPAGPPNNEVLLAEIRDLLKK